MSAPEVIRRLENFTYESQARRTHLQSIVLSRYVCGDLECLEQCAWGRKSEVRNEARMNVVFELKLSQHFREKPFEV